MAKSRAEKALKAIRKLKASKASKPSSSLTPVPPWVPHPDDILVLVMGPTGYGKSTFINTATGQESTTVGHDLESCTVDITPVRVAHPANPRAHVVFVETRGFDNGEASDTAILEGVTEWLETTYTSEKKLAGIIYLHEITQARTRTAFCTDDKMFQELCSSKAMMNVVTVTTKWDRIGEAEGEARQEQLKNFWATKLGPVSVTESFMCTRESAWKIVDMIYYP